MVWGYLEGLEASYQVGLEEEASCLEGLEEEAFLEVQVASYQGDLEEEAFHPYQEEEVVEGEVQHRPYLVGEEVEEEDQKHLPCLEGVVEEVVTRTPADYCTYFVPFDHTVI